MMVVIEHVKPEIEGGRFYAKRVVGEKIEVSADIFTDGHDVIAAKLLYQKRHDIEYMESPMAHIENDRWSGEFKVNEVGVYYYTIEAWVDHFKTWQRDIKKKYDAGQNIKVDRLIGAEHVKDVLEICKGRDAVKLQKLVHVLSKEKHADKAVKVALSKVVTELMDKYPNRSRMTRYGRDLCVMVERNKALFSAWYELFPRSCPNKLGRHGTFRDCETALSEIAKMGFDVLYLPPIHPIGATNRKGKNNSPASGTNEAGSPWAIGSEQGGHYEINSDLGSFEDFENLIQKARDYNIEIAIDIAFQCSPDHPYVTEHPEWFKRRPDGTMQYAENPPKKYEDVLPLNFDIEKRKPLWNEMKSILEFWVDKGVKIFRVDNPHTKPFLFWEWIIREIKNKCPEVIFLSEAFTRPKVMNYLAKVGFTQSYTYFTWRNTKKEFTDYMEELIKGESREFLRPNFWTNTPDILAEHLQYGGRQMFMTRLVLAATLSSNYGIYGPAYELCVNDALPGTEEYRGSEKYEVKEWDWDMPGNIKDFIARINRIRSENMALHTTWNIKFHEINNDSILFYSKSTEDFSNVMLIGVNLDPNYKQSGWVKVPLRELGIDPDQPYLVHDLLGDAKYIWNGEWNYIELDPRILPAHIFLVRKKLKRETDFDYFV